MFGINDEKNNVGLGFALFRNRVNPLKINQKILIHLYS